jgi:hypothetical protein
MVSSKCKIVIVDKKGNYSFLFKGFRKNKFTISILETVLAIPSEEMLHFNLFFVVLYELRDVFELLKLSNGEIPLIVASENVKIIKKLQKLNYFQVVDLSKSIGVTSRIHDCMNEIFKK